MNLWGKTRKRDNPYLVVINDGWEWRVLKAYQTREQEKRNAYARWFCAVSSPLTQGGWDLGDTYIADIPLDANNREVLAERERAEHAQGAMKSAQKVLSKGCGYLLWSRTHNCLAPCGAEAHHTLRDAHGKWVPLCDEHYSFACDARERKS